MKRFGRIMQKMKNKIKKESIFCRFFAEYNNMKIKQMKELSCQVA